MRLPRMEAIALAPTATRSEPWERPEPWLLLFKELAAGRSDALEVLYDLASGRLYGLALWRTGSREDAADVVQEVFVQVAEQRRQLAGVRDPRWWLLAVTHRLAIDITRRRRRRRTEPIDDHPYLEAPTAQPRARVGCTTPLRASGTHCAEAARGDLPPSHLRDELCGHRAQPRHPDLHRGQPLSARPIEASTSVQERIMNDPLSGFEIPRPPAELREATLATAVARWSHPADVDHWRWIWESRPIRVAWGATVVVLVAMILVLPRKTARPRASRSTPDELQEVISLPRLRTGYVAATHEPRREKRS